MGNDFMIKIWTMGINELYDPNKSEAAILVFELASAVNIECLGPPSTVFAINPYKKLIAVTACFNYCGF